MIPSPKLFVGPMTKNVVDACIEYSNSTGKPLGLIPSRRQVDMSSGYVHSWTTDTFSAYVRAATKNIVIERDHGGPGQGDADDLGYASLVRDAKHFDIIHIDPFKKCESLETAIAYTAFLMNAVSEISNCRFEIGTEEAIYPMSVDVASKFFHGVKKKVGGMFDRVEYLVVQFGTKIIGSHNTGQFDECRARNMLQLCGELEKKSKEHNGDYLSADGVKKRRAMGLVALNVAPEMGGIESEAILQEMGDREDLIDRFLSLCLSTNRWQKWFPVGFDPHTDKRGVILACGHYCFSHQEFRDLMSEVDYTKVVNSAKTKMKERIEQLS